MPLARDEEFFSGYISDISLCRQHGETITIVELAFAAESRLAGTLHTNTVDILRNQLKRQHEIVIINVSCHVDESDAMWGSGSALGWWFACVEKQKAALDGGRLFVWECWLTLG